MILQPNDPSLIDQIIPDSFIGNISFKWEKEAFKKVMRHLDFQKIKKGDQDTYKKRVNSLNPCTLVAYHTGKINLNGCHSHEEMQQIVRQLMQKMGELHQINIFLKQKLTVVSFRCKIQYNLMFDIKKLSEYLFQLQLYTKSIEHKVQFVPQHSKVMVPEWIHNIKNMRLFVIRLGYIQIYKANLIPNLQKFGRKIYETLLYKFGKPLCEKQELYQSNKHEHEKKNPVIKTVVIRNGEKTQLKQQKHEKKKNNNEFIRYQFEEDLEEAEIDAEE